MAFKLKSGNKTPFKLMGSSPIKQVDDKRETVEQYNARVKADYDAKMQSYQDSTASYQNQLEIKRKLDEASLITTEDIEVPEERWVTGQEIIDAGGEVEGVNWNKDKDTGGNPIDPNKMYPIPLQGVTSEQKASNKAIRERNELKFQKGERLLDEAGDLHIENISRGIYTDFGFDTNPDDLRPTKPIKPIEKMERIDIKNIDMGEPTTPNILETSKRKYIKSGKHKINLETGEKTKIKTKKVKKKKRPRKRKVKNLVTGGVNIVQ